MKIGIVCATDDELSPFLAMIDNYNITKKAMLKFYEGEIYGMQVVTLFSGVCKVNAAIATQILIDHFNVNIVINAGTAGGMNPKLKIFDTVISTEVCYHDVAQDTLTEFHPWLKTVFFKADQDLIKISKRAVKNIESKNKVFWGRIVTGEAFITDMGRKKINDEFAPLAVDMETASIAHVCYVNKIPFLSIRCITDNAEHKGVENFEKNSIKSSIIAKNITLAILKEYSQHKDEMDEINNCIAQWKPRCFKETKFPINVLTTDFEINTPEYILKSILIFWQRKQYGKIASFVMVFSDKSNNKLAGEIRKELEYKEIVDAQITNIIDESPAITEITVDIQYKVKEKLKSISNYKIRLLCRDQKGNPITRNYEDSDIIWNFIPTFIYNLV